MECKTERKNGRLTINIDGRNYLPLAFKTFRASARNISDFYKAGIRLFNVLTGSIISAVGIPYSLFGETWLDDRTYDFEPIDRQIELFEANAPEGYLSIMIQLDTREWWLKKRKGYPYSFTHLAQMEADPLWRGLASEYMNAVISHVEEKYGDRVFGYFLLCGTTTEWFSRESYEEPSPLSEKKYAEWKGSASARVPDKELRDADPSVIFLPENQYSDVIEYRRFESWQRSDTVAFFCAKAQEILCHRKLLGLYYGYIHDLVDIWECGNLDYERIFLSSDVDMISSPMSYDYRAQDSASQYMLTAKTLDLHDKLYFLEHDQTTCITPDIIEGARFVHPHKAKTVIEDVNILRQDFMLAFANGIAMWWFDMFGGWWYHPVFMREIKNFIFITERMSAVEYKSLAEIAVITEPESLYYFNKTSRINVPLLCEQRLELAYAGAPYDSYSFCDAHLIDVDRYKLFIFLCSARQNEKLSEFVGKLKKCGKTLLFSYVCNAVGKTVDAAKMSEMLEFKTENNVCAESTMIFEGKELSASREAECFDIADGTVPLAYYKKSGRCAAGYVRKGYITGFSGIPTVKAEILREFMKLSGVHAYTFDDNTVVYVNSAGYGIYHRTGKDAVIRVKRDGEFTDVFENRQYVSENGILKVPAGGGKAKLLIEKSFWK